MAGANNHSVDYLIIGQGLAGTILGYQLLKRGKSILIVDQKDESSSSRVAAGLFNPITGRKFVKTWKADQLFNYLPTFYGELENYLRAKFYFERDIYRPFENLGEQNDWVVKSNQQEFCDYVSLIFDDKKFPDIHNRFGGLLLKKGGMVDISQMLDNAREKFLELGCLREEIFDEERLKVDQEKVSYKDVESTRLIFCTGSAANKSSYFSWLPFRPVKGEVLHVISNDETDTIFNKGCFITPPNDGVSKAGSTYDWKDLTKIPTEQARSTIMTKLNALIKWQVKVVDQKAGIRPATADRKPLIGVHPKFKTIAIFNGLGTKGVTLAPYFSGQFVANLEDGLNLDREVDIKRYYSLYYNSYSS